MTRQVLRALLLVISEDEARHAELAFCLVQWAVLTSGPAARLLEPSAGTTSALVLNL